MTHKVSRIAGITFALALLTTISGMQSGDVVYAAAAQEETVYLPSLSNSSVTAQQDGEIFSDNEDANAEVEETLKSNVDLDATGPVSADSHYQDGDGPWAQPAESSINSAATNAFDTTDWSVRDNLGVGTDSPVHRIEVNDNVNWVNRLLIRNNHSGNHVSSDLYLTTGSAKGLMIQKFGTGFSKFQWSGIDLADYARIRTDTGVNGLIQTTGVGPMIFGTEDTERMRINANGGLTVGWSGGYGIEVENATKDGVRISNALNDGLFVTRSGRIGAFIYRPGTDGVEINRAGDDGVYIYYPQGTGVKMTGAGVDGLSIYNSGRYGLHVNGAGSGYGVYVENSDIRVRNGNIIDDGTTLNVPDYVFEEEYPLMSLDELRAFINTEKHLPNVPSEEEIHANGINLSEFHMRLLEKVEELTLYTLEQHEVIETQRNELDAQQAQIDMLMVRLATLEASHSFDEERESPDAQ